MNWNFLKTADQVKQIQEESQTRPVLIFKHSSRCNISVTTLDRLERHWSQDEMSEIKPYFLDLLSYRSISNLIAQNFKVEHESPQVLIIQNGLSIYDRSHYEIDYQKIMAVIKNQK